ncbi:MAG TPA: helix-turn-helix domain-containing protein [Candidatus Binatia bacterium]|nr:helix-turn-helix domain-containing protein [Candidatus Binatia bacterium]
MITVKDVWRGALPAGTELLGGRAGLDRQVDWATSLRTRAPAFEAIKGGEVAFIAIRSIHLLDERLDLPRVLESFAEKGGVAAAVVGDVTAEAVELADRLLLPLLRLPDQCHLADVQQATTRFILDQRTALHDRAQELQAELMELALGGAGPGGIVDRLASLLGLATAWQEESGEVRRVAGTTPPLAGIDPWSTEMAAIRRFADSSVVLAANPPVREFPVGAPGIARLVAPIPLREGIGGFVSVLGLELDLGQLARLGCARAASACAIELDRERAVLAARDDLEGEFVTALLTGAYSSEASMLERARRVGASLAGESLVMVARASSPMPQGWPESGVRAAQRWAQRRELPVLVAAHQGAMVLVTGAALSEPRRAAAELVSDCRAATGGLVAVGIGRPKHGLAGIRASHREAEQAIGMGGKLNGMAPVVDFADLGLHRLLYAMAQHAELHEFYRDSLGALVAYDERGGGDLLKTLDAFFECRGSPTETAQRLRLHRNTVLYRLRRIEEVGRLSLADPATRLNLQLCLRIRDVLEATG